MKKKALAITMASAMVMTALASTMASADHTESTKTISGYDVTGISHSGNSSGYGSTVAGTILVQSKVTSDFHYTNSGGVNKICTKSFNDAGNYAVVSYDPYIMRYVESTHTADTNSASAKTWETSTK